MKDVYFCYFSTFLLPLKICVSSTYQHSVGYNYNYLNIAIHLYVIRNKSLKGAKTYSVQEAVIVVSVSDTISSEPNKFNYNFEYNMLN